MQVVLGIVLATAILWFWFDALGGAWRLSRPLWFLFILLAPIVGTMLWFLVGSSRSRARG